MVYKSFTMFGHHLQQVCAKFLTNSCVFATRDLYQSHIIPNCNMLSCTILRSPLILWMMEYVRTALVFGAICELLDVRICHHSSLVKHFRTSLVFVHLWIAWCGSVMTVQVQCCSYSGHVILLREDYPLQCHDLMDYCSGLWSVFRCRIQLKSDNGWILKIKSLIKLKGIHSFYHIDRQVFWGNWYIKGTVSYLLELQEEDEAKQVQQEQSKSGSMHHQ
jgi:hypothetical protein